MKNKHDIKLENGYCVYCGKDMLYIFGIISETDMNSLTSNTKEYLDNIHTCVGCGKVKYIPKNK